MLSVLYTKNVVQMGGSTLIRKQHQKVIDRLVDQFSHDERYLALIIGGAVAKGTAKDNSDVDIILVVTDEEFARRKSTNNCIYYDRECDYEGGYVDGKTVNLQFLKDAADHGSEPARWAFTGAYAAFSHISGLDVLIKQIPVYQESEQAYKLRSFYSQLLLLPWFVGQGKKRGEPFLVMKAAAETIFYAARMVLAQNKMLFPNPKWLLHEMRKAPNLPDNIESLFDNAIAQPNVETTEAIRNCINDHYGEHGFTWEELITTFIEDCEWNWQEHRPPVQDW